MQAPVCLGRPVDVLPTQENNQFRMNEFLSFQK